ncbi:hypothetical protein AOQ84DRAFT_115296 [Glonium stellatum]|uniref:Uncharacterized protein n=1 Tax=Glonium stellatum TaxID=574774 RepID=A0A8E2ETW6_9PEZI|nr:hypothetical protein AOQ84DRAFT_115296 [Glonium stellatum]
MARLTKFALVFTPFSTASSILSIQNNICFVIFVLTVIPVLLISILIGMKGLSRKEILRRSRESSTHLRHKVVSLVYRVPNDNPHNA